MNMMRGGNRQMRRMMDKMGLDMEEIPNVQEVIIIPEVMPPSTPPAWLLTKPSGVISSRCCSPRWLTPRSRRRLPRL